MTDYSEYLISNQWKEVRELALERAKGRCQICGSSRDLDVHHNTYDNLFISHSTKRTRTPANEGSEYSPTDVVSPVLAIASVAVDAYEMQQEQKREKQMADARRDITS